MAAPELVSARARKPPLGRGPMQVLFDTACEAGVKLRTSGANVIVSPCPVSAPRHVANIEGALESAVTAAAA